MPLAYKYRPKNLKEFVGQKEAIEFFRNWIKKWKKGKALLFHGPPGVGKTALVEAFISENKFDLIEMNASDFRSEKRIDEVLGRSSQQLSLFNRGKIFLIDEIDGLAGQEDRGGVGEIIDIIKKSIHPIVLTANDPWNPKLRSLRSYVQMVEFKKLHVWDVDKRLKEVAENENIKIGSEFIRYLSKRSEGDLRAALNDLETVSSISRLSLENIENLGFRERDENIFEVVRNIFKTRTAIAAKLAINNSDKDPDEIFWWIENNVANEYEDAEEIAKAFDALSRADIFKRRILASQNWSMMSYMIDLMTAGVATAKKDIYRKFTRYQYPSSFIALARMKETKQLKSEIFEKLSLELHCSKRKIKNEYLPYLKIFFKNSAFKKAFIESHTFEKEDVMEFLK